MIHRHSTLEQIERNFWPDGEYPTGLVKRCHELRKVPLNRLTVEDLRLLIGQGIGLPYLIPIALEFLEENPLAEGDYFPGDLLKNVLAVEDAYWLEHLEQRIVLDRLDAPVQDRSKK